MAHGVQNILIIRLSAIGDVVHVLPCLEVLRRARPDARIGWMAEELSAPLLQNHPFLDRLYVIPKRRWRGHWFRLWRREIVPFFRAIRADGWDAAIDFQGLLKSGLASWATGARVRIGYGDRDGRELSQLFATRRIKPPPDMRHVVERNLALLGGVGIAPPTERIYGTIPLQGQEKEFARGFFAEWGVDPARDVVAINPGAGWKTKRWPWRHYIDAAEGIWHELGLRPLIVWGPKDEEARDTIVASLRERKVDARPAPPTGLRELAALVREVALFIGGDTGPTHIAALQGVATVGLFGGSDAVRNGPWGPRATALQIHDLPCVPCWRRECRLPRDRQEIIPCLERLTSASVVAAARALLAAPRAPGI